MGTGPSRTEVVTVCVVRIKKTKWILEAKFLKEERSWQNSLLGIFAKEREKKKKRKSSQKLHIRPESIFL